MAASGSFSGYLDDINNWPRSTHYGLISRIKLDSYDEFTSEIYYNNFLTTLLRESPMRYRLTAETTMQIYRLHFQYDRGCILFPDQFQGFECFTTVTQYHINNSFLPSIHDESMDYFNCNKLCLLCYAMKRGLVLSLYNNSDDSSDSDGTAPLPHRDHKVSFNLKHYRSHYLLDDLYIQNCFWCDNCFRPLFKTYAILEGVKSDQIYPEKDNFLFSSYISRNGTYHLFPTSITDISRVTYRGKCL